MILRLFSQCTIQKVPHLLGAEVMHLLPLDYDARHWEEWKGPLTERVDGQIVSFLEDLTGREIPQTSLLLSQISVAHGGLGLLNASARATSCSRWRWRCAMQCKVLLSIRTWSPVSFIPPSRTYTAVLAIPAPSSSNVLSYYSSQLRRSPAVPDARPASEPINSSPKLPTTVPEDAYAATAAKDWLMPYTST